MASNPGTLPIWQITNAWREILTRIFGDTEVKINVSPEWLINPVTNRRLKLDLLYPQMGVAVRFEGLRGKQRHRRPSLEEEAQQKLRDSARVEVCRVHGIELVVVDLTDDNPKNTFREIDLGLSRAKEQAKDEKLVHQIGQARSIGAKLSHRISHLGDLKLFTDLWEDRQYQISKPAQPPAQAGDSPSYTVGLEVEHTTFGPGVISAITISDDNTLLTVDFVIAGQKTLMASLVADKLSRKSR